MDAREQKDPGLLRLVDQNLIELLKACSNLRYPSIFELKSKQVKFGEKLRQKLLVLDMDETLFHAKFINPQASGLPQSCI